MATSMAQAIEALTFRYETEGAEKVTAAADKMVAANKRAAASIDGVAVAEERTTRVRQSAESSWNAVLRKYDESIRKQNEYERVQRISQAAMMQGIAGESERRRVMDLVTASLDRQTAAANRAAAATRGLAVANDNAARARRTNLGYQGFDIAQGVAMGAPVGMIAAQQIPQVLQLYAAQGGLNALWRDAVGILGGLVRAAGPWLAAAGAIYGVYRLISSSGGEATLAIDDATRALAEQAAPIGSVRGMIADLASTQSTYTKAISDTGAMQDATTALVVASSEREYNAKRQLLEIELKRQNAAIAVQEAEIKLEGYRMKREVAGNITQRPDLVARGFEDPRIGRFVNLPDDITGMSRLNEVMAPFLERIGEMRARLDLAKISTEQLEAALGVAFDPGKSGAAAAKVAVDAVTASVGRLQGALDQLSGIAAPTFSDAAAAANAFDKAMREASGLEERIGILREYEQTLERIRTNALDQLAKKEREVSIGAMSARDAAAARLQDSYATMIAGLREMGLGEDVVARATAAMNAELAQSSAHFDAIDQKAGERGAAKALKEFNSEAEQINGLFTDIGNTLAGIFSKPIEDAWDFADAVIGAIGSIGQKLMGLQQFDWAKALGLKVDPVAEMAARAIPATYVGSPAHGARGASELQGYTAVTSLERTARSFDTSVTGLTAFIRQAASARNIDPEIAVRVARSEGLAEGVWQSNLIMKNGQREPSYGPFQLYTGGGLGNKFQRQTGLNPSDPSTVFQQIEFALNEAAAGGWGPWYGAAKVGIGNRTGLAGAQPISFTPGSVPAAANTNLPQFAPLPTASPVSGLGATGGSAATFSRFAGVAGAGLSGFASGYASQNPLSGMFSGALGALGTGDPAAIAVGAIAGIKGGRSGIVRRGQIIYLDQKEKAA